MDFDRDPDDVPCPRPEVYRDTGGRKRVLCEYLRDEFGGPTNCEEHTYKKNIVAALERHPTHLQNQNAKGRLRAHLPQDL